MTRRNLTASIRLTASVGPAPARFRIWRAGSNPGDYGDLEFTPSAAARVMAAYEQRGNALIMDIEHALNPQVNPTLDPADPPPTAGYLALELVDTEAGPELWGVPRWSDCGRDAPVPDEVCCARHQIESGQRCYVSPDWQIDMETREPIALNRVSLVAEPATWGVNLLASRAATGTGDNMADNEGLRAAYAAAMGLQKSSNAKIAKAASTMVAELGEAAAALNIQLEDGEDKAPDSKKSEGQTAAEGNEDMGQNKGAAVDTDKGTGGDNGPAVASVAASKGASKSLTLEDVRAEIARGAEESRLRTLVASRLPKESANLVASMSLAQLRTAARDLPAPPPADKGTGGDNGGNVTAGATAELSVDESFLVRRWKRGLEVKEANLTAAKKAWEADPYGGEVVVDPFAALCRGTTGKSAPARAEG